VVDSPKPSERPVIGRVGRGRPSRRRVRLWADPDGFSLIGMSGQSVPQ